MTDWMDEMEPLGPGGVVCGSPYCDHLCTRIDEHMCDEPVCECVAGGIPLTHLIGSPTEQPEVDRSQPVSPEWVPRTLTAEECAVVEEVNAAIRANYEHLARVFSSPMPVGCVQWLPLDKVRANDYNPNSVAGHEMRLLHTSVAEDGLTQPIVAMWDEETEQAVIVDGFHRYTVMLKYADLYDQTGGYVPVVLIDKPVADRIASTVRHNRARGKHSVAGMSNLVFSMLREGVTDAEICNKIGLEAEELARLKHITGYSRLYKEHSFSAVRQTESQLEAKAVYKKAHPDEQIPRW